MSEQGQTVAPMSLHSVEPMQRHLETSFRADMRVPVRVIADEELLRRIREDRSLEQLVNVSTLPGITHFALGMPDMHEGYGFPVGGVAATALPHGVISPGGIGFDINCGVRLLASALKVADWPGLVPRLLHELGRSIPTGYGRAGRLSLDEGQLEHVLAEGVPYLIHTLGKGLKEDVENTESSGCMPQANPQEVSRRAKQRGAGQLGTLGGGNHFLEIQVVEQVLLPEAAKVMGLFEGQLTILLHTGSRGLGHQVCTDALRTLEGKSYPFHLPDRQLACAPFDSREGQSYFQAMGAASNFAFCNRQLLTHVTREVFRRVLHDGADASLRLVYDVAHNTAKIETLDGRRHCVHRKGATRAFGPRHPEVPVAYRGIGQPVFIPGSMGTASWVLVGTDASLEVALGSCCHGAGRTMSRGAARRKVAGHDLRRALAEKGISVVCPSNVELAEEAPEAYKDIDRVAEVVSLANIARKVARLRPLGVLKG